MYTRRRDVAIEDVGLVTENAEGVTGGLTEEGPKDASAEVPGADER